MTTASTSLERRGFAPKPLHIMGIAMVVFAVVLGYMGLRESFRPYTTQVNEAVSADRAVQIKGFLGSNGAYDTEGNFTFDFKDETGKMMKVVYAKPKPSNFEQAVSLVVIGHYDTAKSAFFAEDILVQCPSKYQEQGGTPPHS